MMNFSLLKLQIPSRLTNCNVKALDWNRVHITPVFKCNTIQAILLQYKLLSTTCLEYVKIRVEYREYLQMQTNWRTVGRWKPKIYRSQLFFSFPL